ncbi:MAG TPA: tetratricopeptide repeat protein, partial [Streptosporangiaceae bacterium]|nr:tetratricopeptide repeat protein [Streptosporangiaceae bacterium]
NGTIAVANLHAQIAGLAARARPAPPGQAAAPLAVAAQALLVDLLTLRGETLGRIADYEHAAELADELVNDAPEDGRAWLARARTRATFHRFAEAMADLETAGQNGLDRATVDAERAPILQAVGCYWHALVLCEEAAKRRPGFTTLGALAVLQSERGEVTHAEPLFDQARRCYQDISPFPLASLDYRRGLMWLGQGDLPAARSWFAAAQRRVPAYAPALARLAEADAALGHPRDAISRLRPLVSSSDDPHYAASLARVLGAVGCHREARRWHDRAAARHAELILRHPEAFAHHAADFRPDAAEPSARFAPAS